MCNFRGFVKLKKPEITLEVGGTRPHSDFFGKIVQKQSYTTFGVTIYAKCILFVSIVVRY